MGISKEITCGLLTLAASGSALAQSSVTLYGIVENGVSYTTHANAQGSVLAEASGMLTTSRYGMRGREDLGGGWAAVFALEQGFSVASGAAVSQEWGRDSWVGIDGPYGRVTFGRTYAPITDAAYAADPLAEATGTASILGLGQLSVLVPGNNYRLDNTIKYLTPKWWGAIVGSVLYAFGSAGSNVQKSDLGAHLAYMGPSFSLVAAYNREYNPWDASGAAINAVAAGRAITGVSGAAYINNWKRQTWLLGGTYTITSTTLYAGYSGDIDEPSGDGPRSFRTQLFWAGASYQPLPDLSLRAGYYKLHISDTNIHPTLVGARLDYFLSKQVDTYLLAAFVRNQGGAATSFPVVALGTSAAGTAYGSSQFQQTLVPTGGVASGKNQLQLGAGLRYMF
jgi:general bacterial porin, GBP family